MALWAAWGALLVVGFTHRHDLRYLIAIPLGAAALWAAVVPGLGSVLGFGVRNVFPLAAEFPPGSVHVTTTDAVAALLVDAPE